MEGETAILRKRKDEQEQNSAKGRIAVTGNHIPGGNDTIQNAGVLCVSHSASSTMAQQHHHHHYHEHHHQHDHHYSMLPAVVAPVTSTAAMAATFDALRIARHNAMTTTSTITIDSSSMTPIAQLLNVSNALPEQESGNDEYIIILPFIVLFGLCGNIISLVAIFHSRLRKMAANQYLIMLTTADSVFLLGIILVLFKVDFTGYFLCVGVEYVLMSASYVSSWSIAALTIERYLAIAHPLKHVQYGYVSRWRIMCFWVPIPFVLNLIQFVTLSPNSDPSDPDWPNVRKCTVKDGRLQMIVELIDVVLCYILPCITVVVLNLLIASKVESAEKIFKKTPPKDLPKMSTTSISRIDSPKISLINHTSNGEASSKNNRRFPMKSAPVAPPDASTSSASSSGSTRILVVVPLVYILLNSPFYLFRIIDTIALNVFQCKAFSIQGGLNDPRILFLYNAAHYLYYVNFACDFVVYAFSSKNFRRTVVIAWRRLLYAKWSNQTDYLESIARNSYNRYVNNNISTNDQRTTRLITTNSITSTSQANTSIASTTNEAPAGYSSMSRSSTQLSRWQRDL